VTATKPGQLSSVSGDAGYAPHAARSASHSGLLYHLCMRWYLLVASVLAAHQGIACQRAASRAGMWWRCYFLALLAGRTLSHAIKKAEIQHKIAC